jgi:hypothetical protein
MHSVIAGCSHRCIGAVTYHYLRHNSDITLSRRCCVAAVATVLQISAFAGDDALTLRHRGQQQPMLNSISASSLCSAETHSGGLLQSYWKAVLFQYVFTVVNCHSNCCIVHRHCQRYRCVTALYW